MTDMLRPVRSGCYLRSHGSEVLFKSFASQNQGSNDEEHYDGECCHTQGNQDEIQKMGIALFTGIPLSDDDNGAIAGVGYSGL